jgi:simple sugar transport system permease protein
MIDIVLRAVVAGTPLFLASMGELITERSGVLNLGIEGIFVAGASAGFVATILTGDPLIGLVAGCLVGVVIGLLHAIISVSFRAQQVVSGLALTMFGYGLASVMGRGLVGTPLPTYINADDIATYLLLAEIFIATLIWYVLFRLKLGAMLRAVGENPRAAEILGVDVVKTRILATMLGSTLAGLGGAWFTLGYIHVWTEGVGMGRGWIAIAIVIVSGWNPLLIPLFSYLFAGVEVAIWSLQLPPYNISPYILGALPYVVTLLSLVVFMATPAKKVFRPPSALGQAFYREA